MSLATRCTACGTVFRVVQDQLKVSEGWVRCGRCSEVFNALEGLFDLERDAPRDWVASRAETAPAMHHGQADSVLPEPDSDARDSSFMDRIDAQLTGSHRSEEGSTPATRIDERDRLEFPDAQFDPDVLEEMTTPNAGGPDEAAALVADDPDVASSDGAAPGFVRQAQRHARWQSTGARAGLLAASALLLVALSIQLGHHFRDVIAARWPVSRPVLTAWCGLAACTIEAPRRIEDVMVESSGLARASAPESFVLSVVLRNRGTIPVVLPSVDLSLTDPAGQLVARRVLTPADFHAPSSTMQAGAGLPLRMMLTAVGARVTGYTVEVFYP